MLSKCMFCGSDLDTGMNCRNPDCESHEPIYINRACAPNCPGNMKPRTSAEAEEMEIRFLVSQKFNSRLQNLYEWGRIVMNKTEPNRYRTTRMLLLKKEKNPLRPYKKLVSYDERKAELDKAR